jgi:crossover junction endodeoxyribonuclease RuvC
MNFLGIDPGKQGAIAVYDKAAHRVTCHDMPGTTAELHDLIASLPEIRICILEKPFYPQSIGTSNAARIAEAFGVLKGALAWRSIPVELVAPAKWKASLNLSTVKSASREKASQLFPDDAAQFKRAKDDGRAEAALLAWFGLGKVR